VAQSKLLPLTNFGANDDHEVGDRLTLVDENGLYCPIQHPYSQSSHLPLVLQNILCKRNSLLNESSASLFNEVEEAI
jgi:hypothetical protein